MRETTSDGFSELVRANRKTRNAALLRAATELYALDTDHSTDQNRRFEELATHLLPEVPVADRRYAAELLAEVADAPAPVLRLLARDVPEVAEPVLLKSPALATFDLLAVIAGTDAGHHAIIARRPDLPEEVRRALSVMRTENEPEEDAATDEAPPSQTDDGFALGVGALDAVISAADRLSGDTVAPASAAAWDFLALERRDRLRRVAELASRPVLATADTGGSAGKAFDRIVNTAQVIGFARARKTGELIAAVARGLDLAPQFVAASINDQTGEPLAILLKALRLDDATAQQVFLMASPVGRDVARFFPLADFYSGMEPVVAEAMLHEWRGAADQHRDHAPLMPDIAARRREQAHGRIGGRVEADQTQGVRPAEARRA